MLSAGEVAKCPSIAAFLSLTFRLARDERKTFRSKAISVSGSRRCRVHYTDGDYLGAKLADAAGDYGGALSRRRWRPCAGANALAPPVRAVGPAGDCGELRR